MVQHDYLQFSKDDEEIATIFKAIGLKINISRVLVMFLKGYELTSREVERYTDLRQPEVSIAINALVKRRWVEVTRHITENKGRPIKIYSLAIQGDEILDELEENIKSDYSKQMESIERIRVLVKERYEVTREHS